MGKQTKTCSHVIVHNFVSFHRLAWHSVITKGLFIWEAGRDVKRDLAMHVYISYIIVESVSFVLSRDVYPINPYKTIEIINSKMYTYTSLEFIILIVFETSS